MRPVPADVVVRELVEHIAEALSATGDLRPVLDALAELRRRGTGAQVQRALLEQRGNLRDVVTACVRHTQG
jgi:carboxylate-amine ligase